MRIDVISIFPEMFAAIRDYGVVGRAIRQELLTVQLWNLRDYAQDKHRTVDDRPYGGGPGMVLRTEPLAACLAAVTAIRPKAVVSYLSPQGRRLDHAGVAELASRERLILLAGRYEGVDERLLQTAIGEEWSIGDYVLSGGELPAMVVIDAVARRLPGVLGDEASAEQDSFVDGLLDCPHYTRPEEYDGLRVPAVLLSGDHERVRRWRKKQALGRTWLRRPDLLATRAMSDEERVLLEEFIQEHEAARGSL